MESSQHIIFFSTADHIKHVSINSNWTLHKYIFKSPWFSPINVLLNTNKKKIWRKEGKYKDIPESVDGIIGYIREQRLIDVKDPGVVPVIGDLDASCKGQRLIHDDVGVRRVPRAAHVLLHEFAAPERDRPPEPGVVGLHREPPAVAVEVVVGEGGGGDGLGRGPEYGLGWLGGHDPEEEEE